MINVCKITRNWPQRFEVLVDTLTMAIRPMSSQPPHLPTQSVASNSSTGEPAKKTRETATIRKAEFSYEGPRIEMRCRINGTTEGVFMLDTGAEVTAVSEAFAKKLGLQPTGHFQVAKATGGIEQMPYSIVKSIESAGTAVEDLKVLMIPDLAGGMLDGVLGLNYLRHFNVNLLPREGKVTCECID